MNAPQMPASGHVERIPNCGWYVETLHEEPTEPAPEHELIVAGRVLHLFETLALPFSLGPGQPPPALIMREIQIPFGRDAAGRGVWERLAYALMTGEEPAPDIQVAKSLSSLLGRDGRPLQG